MAEVNVKYLLKVLKLGKPFQYVIHLVFGMLSDSKVLDLLHIG